MFIPLGYTLHFSRGTRSSSNLICNLSSPWPRCFCVILFEIKNIKREKEKVVFVSESGNNWNSIEFKTATISSSRLAYQNTHKRTIKEQKKTHCKVGTMPDGCTDRSTPPSVSVVVVVVTMGKGAAPSLGGFVCGASPAI